MAIMLSIAYGANVGGIGTKIGTAPNAQFSGFMERSGISISFLQFLAVGLPFVLLFLPVVWWMLWRIGREGRARQGRSGPRSCTASWPGSARCRRPERIVLGVFLATAVLWIAGKGLTALLEPHVTAFKLTSAHVEGGIAMLAAFLLILWRTEGRQVLGFRALSRVPWETLLLLGGGFAMAAAIQKSGLSDFLSAQLVAVRGLPPFGQVLLAALPRSPSRPWPRTRPLSPSCSSSSRTRWLPEVMTTVLFAATLACSCDFALPAGTPPNAIVFGSGYVTIPGWRGSGVVLDLLAAAPRGGLVLADRPLGSLKERSPLKTKSRPPRSRPASRGRSTG